MQYHRSKSIAKPKKCVSAKCHRCGGGGVVPPWGQCFRCGGNGRDPSDLEWCYPAGWSDEQCAEHVAALDAKNEAARKRAQAKRDAKGDAIFAENVAAFPAIGEADAIRDEWYRLCPAGKSDEHGNPIADEAADRAYLEYERDNPRLPPFVMDILFKARKFRLSEKQAAAVARAIDQHKNRVANEAARRAAAKPVPAGRAVIEGVIVSTKMVSSRYGETMKMLVKGDGWKVFGTVPSGLDPVVGASVKFRAMVEPSDDDPAFGFFSRPRTLAGDLA